MKASPYYLRTAVMRRWTVEAGGMEGRSGAAHGVSVRTLYRVNQIRRLDRQVALAEVGGQQELAWSSEGEARRWRQC